MCKWILAVCLTTSVFASAALAAEPAAATAQAKLESISGKTAAAKAAQDECPMQHDKQKCDHKNGEPCPYHDKGHHAHKHDKCEHEQRGQ